MARRSKRKRADDSGLCKGLPGGSGRARRLARAAVGVLIGVAAVGVLIGVASGPAVRAQYDTRISGNQCDPLEGPCGSPTVPAPDNCPDPLPEPGPARP